MQVISIAECSRAYSRGHSAILSTFTKLPFVTKIFALSIFEWPLNTGFTVLDFADTMYVITPSKERILMALVRLHECAGWSEP